MAYNLKQQIQDRTKQFRRKKDFMVRNRHRIARISGDVKICSSRRTYDAMVTPLTQLQHGARLPRHTEETSFPFEHTLSFSAFWGPTQTKTESGHTKCTVTIPLRGLGLTQKQRVILRDVVGAENVRGEELRLSADVFPDTNHNAAYLGDVTRRLIQELKNL